MKKIYLILVSIMLTANISAQSNSTQSNFKNSEGICGLIKEGDAGSTVKKDAPLVLYMHDSLQNRDIEIIFTESIRKKMSYDPYAKLVNQIVCITGQLDTYNNAPAIIIRNEKQIKVSDKAQIDKTDANH